ncbi:MAG TPA: hypothetical protein VJ890_00515 [Vineibacter sp.]|nr:hypothetical protein [Vineibacter sp.]
MRRAAYALLVANIAVGTLPSIAQDVVPWKEVGNWTVNVDRTVQDGCYMYAIGVRGTISRIGFTSSRALYWMLGHDDWQSLEKGKEYSISVSFDGASPFTGRMRAVQLRNSVLLGIEIPRGFLDQFMRSQIMEVMFGDRRVARLNLRGSYAAGEELILCQTMIDGGRTPQAGPPARDPFSNIPSGTAPRDPFR